MSPLGFKARVVSALFAFCGGKCNVHSPRSTSGATHANLLAAGMQLVTSSHACAEVLGLDLNAQSPAQKTNALPLCMRRQACFGPLFWRVKVLALRVSLVVKIQYANKFYKCNRIFISITRQ